MNKEYYSIGEVAGICNVNIRTLHYYDSIGLLVPEKVGEDSRYRYYSYQQILEMIIIKEYKVMGFSLKEIGILIKRDDLNLSRSMLESKCEEIDHKITSLTFLKKRLNGYLDAMEQSGGQGVDRETVFLREMKGSYAAYLDYKGSLDEDLINSKFVELLRRIEQADLEVIGDRFTLFYGRIEAIRTENAEARFYIPVRASKEIKDLVFYIPKCKVITKTHYGSHEEMGVTYGQLAEFIKENKLSIQDAVINHSIIDIVSSQKEEEFVMEVILMMKE